MNKNMGMKKIEVAIVQLHRCYGLVQKLSNATLFNIKILKPPYTHVRVRIRGLEYDVQKFLLRNFWISTLQAFRRIAFLTIFSKSTGKHLF